jgi:hypothetical protein
MRRGRLIEKPIVDPNNPGEKMRGNPLSRAMSADGRWAYTLYDGAGATPFVHALDTVARSAHCIDLDGIAGRKDLWQLRLGVEPGNERLVIRNDATRLLLIDLHSLRVARATGADAPRGGTRYLPALLLVSAAGVLAALAASVIWMRRKQRQTLLTNLDPQSES